MGRVSYFSKKQTFTLLFFFTIALLNFQVVNAEAGLEKIKNKETVEIIQKAVDYQNPYTNAVILLYDHRYSVDKTNDVVLTEHVLIKVLTEGGKQAGTVILPFDGYFQKLKINVARTIQPNGDVIDVSPDAISEESPFSNMPIYSDIKIKKMTFSAVDVGSVIEYEVEYTMGYKDWPGFFTLFTSPVNNTLLLVRFSVGVPKDTPVKFNAVKIMNAEPVVTSSSGQDRYTWEMDHVWVKGSEDLLLPSYMEFGPYISFSTIKSWEDVYKACNKLMQGQAEPDENIKAKVKELTQGIEGDRVKIIKRLYEYVSQNIQYVAIEWGLSAFRPYPAGQVLVNQYGDCKGKSALLISMLKVVGIPAYYALVLTMDRGFIETGLPSMSFNHAIVAIPEDNGYLFLDPTADILPFNRVPFSVQGADVLILGDKGVELSKIPVESAEENKIYNETNINIHVDCSLAIDSKTKFTGQDEWGQRLAAKYTPPKQYEEYFKQVLNIMIPNSILKEIKKTDYRDLNTPFEIDFMANAANYAKKSDELFMFKVPCDLDSFLALATAAQSRSAPLFILYPRAMERKTVVEIPERYSIKSLPQNTSFDTPHLFFNIEFQPKGSKIIITENLTLSEREISEGRYPRFKNMIDKIRGIYGENIVLEEKKEKQESLGE